MIQKYFLKIHFIIAFLIFFVTLTHTVFAQTYNVSTTEELRQALQDAAGNGQDDVIILADGTYKTTDDGGGTFTFLDDEDYNLTIQGNSPDKVILSGANTNQVLNFNIANFLQTISLINISVIHGNSSGDGGGIYSRENLTLENCTISDNTATDTGGGFYTSDRLSSATTILKGCTISGNVAGADCGGFYAMRDLTMENTNVSGNVSNFSGGGFQTHSFFIKNCVISDNVSAHDGGGFGSTEMGDFNYVINCIISGNETGDDGSAFDIDGGIAMANSIIVNNTSTRADKSAVFLGSNENHIISNSVFINNNEGCDINSFDGGVITVNNCYINESKICMPAFTENNLFDGSLNFTDQANGDFHIGENSVLIDAGTTNFKVDLPETDLDGNQRISGGSIDIGPYEYSTTRPTINAITFSGALKTESEIIFNVDATPSGDRTITKYEMDFGEGTYLPVESSTGHTYSYGGDYVIRAKVTDSAGEYSETSINITVSAPSADIIFKNNFKEAIENNDPEAAKDAIKHLLSSDLEINQASIELYESITEVLYTQDQLDKAVLTEKEKWDQNGDGKYGLSEAIKALQITSGTDQE